jgi:hypothetical protein
MCGKEVKVRKLVRHSVVFSWFQTIGMINDNFEIAVNPCSAMD